MEKQRLKGVRLPPAVIRRIEQITEGEGSTFSQFIRTAAINELSKRKAPRSRTVAA